LNYNFLKFYCYFVYSNCVFIGFNFLTDTHIAEYLSGFAMQSLGMLVAFTLIFFSVQVEGGGLLTSSPWPSYREDSNNTGRSNYVGPQSNHVKWTYGSYQVTSPTIGANGILYCGAGSNVIAIFASGILQLTYSVVGDVIYPPSIGANGTLYAAGGAVLYALTSTGKLIWTYFADQTIIFMVIIAPDGSIYFRASDEYLYSLNSKGTLRWKFYKYCQF
jgi:hypothetical protein